MNYSQINNFKIDQRTLLALLNDESRPVDNIDLTDENDIIVIRFNQAASNAKEIIDTYLGNYQLPFTTIPQRIADISDDITLYNIYKRRSPENIPDSISSIYKDCLTTLLNIQKGLLNIPAPAKTTVTDQGIFRTSKPERIFNPDLMKRY